ncbi:MAG: M20/M25/M40 family metallo-hydrolase [Desulfobacteraceae bacterium]|nr:MAG: M20/M25/M40 family metallo-hydrolase [Desulfobacteraceae bacterium]
MPSLDTKVDYRHPEIILQNLIRFDTTNPPGNEKACVEYITSLFKQNGIESILIAKDPNRPNLIARLKGRGSAPPLLMYGHADVVTTENQTWRHPPFEGKITDGFVWGRGALDMKGMVAMMAAALLRATAENLKPAGDIVFAVLSDEESGGNFGARYLVENHPEQFSGIRYAIGEFGATAIYVGRQRFYPIQVSEKQICWIEATFRGPGGHGSLPIKNSAMSQMARFINTISRKSLPPHITDIPRQMIETIASAMPKPAGLIMRQLLNPMLTEGVLKLLGPKGDKFKPLFLNTINPTVVRGGSKINVIPSEVTLQLDCRLLPGFTPEDLVAELRKTTGTDIAINLLSYDPAPSKPDLSMFGLLADILREADPEGIPVPMLLPGATDGRFFSRLNIQTYGFTPMNLPPEFDFFSTIHAADERVPVDALHFGANTIFRLLERYGVPAK